MHIIFTYNYNITHPSTSAWDGTMGHFPGVGAISSRISGIICIGNFKSNNNILRKSILKK
jgi:hypothetical protein